MRDFRDVVRALRAAPLVSTVAVLSLALGIGANTAIFSILDSLLLRTLPVHEPQRLVKVTTDDGGAWTNPIWEQVRQRRQIFGDVFAWSGAGFDLAQGGQTDPVEGVWASGSMFRTLGVPAVLGRTFTEADDVRGGGPDGPVAVISFGFWQRHYGGAADVIGQTLTLNRVAFTIIGVSPQGFFGPEVGRTFDVAVPLGAEPLTRGHDSALDSRSTWWLSIIARLKSGQSAEAAQTALRGVQTQIRDATLPDNWPPEWLARYLTDPLVTMPVATGESSLRARYQRPVTTIMVVVGLVLLIACANIANLLLARATARRHELSVRQALGASRWRLAQQLLAESLALAAIGAALGVGFAQWGGRFLVRQISTQSRPVFLDLSLDWRMLAFTVLVTVGTALLFGTAPALLSTRAQPIDAMKEQGRGTSPGRGGIANLLVVGQVALSLVLVVAAALFGRTFAGLVRRDLGFERAKVLVVNLGAQRSTVAPDQRAALYERVRDAVAALPGVERAALSVVTPVGGFTWQYDVEEVAGVAFTGRDRNVYVNLVTPGWFATYGTPVVSGRDFDDRDRSGGPPVAIVNQAFARRFLNGGNPVGQSLRQGTIPGRPTIPREMIGVVSDAVYRSLRDPVPPTLYLPLAQADDIRSFMGLSVRARRGSPDLLVGSVAAAIAQVDRDLSITFRPLTAQVDAALGQERLVAMLSAFFGALALLLAGLGLYGVTSYAVNRRRTEIGIRMALGTPPAGVVRLVLRRVAWLVGAGVLVGTAASWWAAKFVESLLYGLSPRDPWTLVVAACVLAVVGAMAGWLPAARAARVDPAEVLREG